ncbi:thioredoxin family protein [Virgibacillus oceani]|uniref:Thiol reductase thioredoxin n=1 Tax=Virgibacillus oceani TaxID=1479511 RepID=A0A917HP07_9BACI|nr:thioredoxin family protein [Virgibacillus oceani]GGG84971.1 thiol reductase thioredoxin [Virgibacillus oceani]
MRIINTIDELNSWKAKGKVITLFTADWCPDCRVIEPVMPEIENSYPDITFIMIDRDRFIEVCQEYEVFGIPSFIAFNDGKEIGRFVSKDRKTKEEITEFIEGLPNQ